MRQFLIACTAVLAGLLLVPVAYAADASLYRALGEKAGIAALMNDFAVRAHDDSRIGHFFKDSKPAGLAKMLTEQVCSLSGGPCIYDGATMAKAHADLEIDRASFNRLVEVLQETMSARGLPFADQNRLLALLAPMHRQIITR